MQPGGKFALRRHLVVEFDETQRPILGWVLTYPDTRFECFLSFYDAIEQMDDLISIYRSRVIRENQRRGKIAEA
jgi:hypothetical protein